MPSSTYKSLRRKKKAAQQFRRGSKTFRRKKNLRQKISVKKLYRKDKKIGKRFTRVARGFVDDLRAAVIHANKLEETCVFCLTPLEEISNTTELVCGHKFHTTCLINSLIIGHNYKCSLCRRPIFNKELEDYIKYVLSVAPEEGLVRATRGVERAVARAVAATAIEGNADTGEELVYIANMVAELAAVRMALSQADTEEASEEVVAAAGARINEMTRMEEVRLATRAAAAA